MAGACLEGACAACISKIKCGEPPTQAETAAVCSSGLVEVLATLMYEQLEAQLQSVHVKGFWEQLVSFQQQPQDVQAALLPALQGLAAAVRQQSQQLSAFAQQLLLGVVQQAQQQQQRQQPDPNAAAAATTLSCAKASWQEAVPASTVALLAGLCQKHRTAVASILMATAPLSLPNVLQQYYRHQLLQLCDAIQQQQAAAAGSSSSGGSDDAMSEGLGSPELHSPGSVAGSSPDRLPGAAHGARQGAGAAAASQLPDPQALLGLDWCAAVAATATCLGDLGLAAASEEAYTAVINSYVLQQLRTLATGKLTRSVLPRAQQLVCAGPLAFLQVLLGQGHSTLVKLQEWQLRLTYLMLETLGALRASDMFDIVIEYPDSAPALSDLALCLAHTNMAAQFAATFKSSLQQRLLHAGAATSDIIHTYVSTIRAMRQLGRSGLLLDIVSEPIRAYLRSRPDTIRCIVSMLTEDNNGLNGGSGSSLLQELQAQQQQQLQGSGAGFSAAGGGSGTGFGPVSGSGLSPGGLAAAVAPPSAVAALSNAGSGKAGARVLFNWCVSEAEGDDAALRLLEALQAAPPDATTAAAAAGAGSTATANSAAAAGGGEGGGLERAAAASELEQAAGLLGLPQTRSAAAAAASYALLSGGRVAADVVSMLIGIYGGPLLFMEEYRLMLADRLLAKDEYDCQREIMTLELLKIRFGEAGLHPCEVMLKDLADSKRLDANVRALHHHQQQQQALPDGVSAALSRLRATICSYLFWPELPEHELKLPAELQTALDVYAERFRHLKAPRKLKWRHSLGLVELTLTIGDAEPLDFRVTPAHAALLLQFSDDSPDATPNAAAASVASSASGAATAVAAGGAAGGVVLSAGQLSAALGVPVPVVRRKAMFWVAAGVLLERRGKGGEIAYSRATSIDPSRIVSREVTDTSWADDTHAAFSAEDRIVAEMGPFENYIIGLLTNCGSLPLDRLHNMLRVFVVGEPKYEGRSQEQLGAFLTVMAGQGKIEGRNGVYSRPKPQQG